MRRNGLGLAERAKISLPLGLRYSKVVVFVSKIDQSTYRFALERSHV